MVLVDTSIWVDHLRRGDKRLAQLLAQNRVMMHPMIMGELACGNLQNRNELLGLWQNLPTVKEATHGEAMYFLEHRQLMGKGIGYVDLHLLTAARLNGSRLWTRDKRLAQLANDIGIAFQHDG